MDNGNLMLIDLVVKLIGAVGIVSVLGFLVHFSRWSGRIEARLEGLISEWTRDRSAFLKRLERIDDKIDRPSP